MIIRFGNSSEYEDVLNIVKQLHIQHVNYRTDIFNNIDVPMSKDEYLELVSKNNIFVIVENHKIVGYASILFRETKNPILCKRKILFIDAIAILDEFQNMGYGKETIKYIKEYAIKELCDSIELQVSIENYKAIKFYFDIEFEEKEKRMELKLSNSIDKI